MLRYNSSGSNTVPQKYDQTLDHKSDFTHGQWLYRNVQVHDSVTGAKASLRKEEIQMEIEKHQELGEEGLLEEDKYLLEVNLEDLETTNGERQEYWLLAIRAAREACRLRRTRENASAAENSNGDELYMASPPRLTKTHFSRQGI